MDPNATLDRIRELLDDLRNPVLSHSERAEMGAELAESVGALDDWLSAGNFPPGPWMDAQ